MLVEKRLSRDDGTCSVLFVSSRASEAARTFHDQINRKPVIQSEAKMISG